MLMDNLKKTLNILYIFKTKFIKINYQSIKIY
jgi:3-deoxy-D-manno-octulosonic acid (KDO) 8-phosphate synthase